MEISVLESNLTKQTHKKLLTNGNKSPINTGKQHNKLTFILF
ncbi:hypothetical protein DPIF89300162_510007 [Tenacibaculum maritimum]|nr:hypothetical protein DPIF89300162_510007 [Tenacibaculum maritimum]